MCSWYCCHQIITHCYVIKFFKELVKLCFNRNIYKNSKKRHWLTKGPFPLRAWKRAFFVSFIDLRLKRAVKIEASAKKINKTNKECSFPRS